LGTEKTGAVRFSFSCFNTEKDVNILLTAKTDFLNISSAFSDISFIGANLRER
jgi:cysteine sulfinate desulfinase/cysteine desulfurase-like protein